MAELILYVRVLCSSFLDSKLLLFSRYQHTFHCVVRCGSCFWGKGSLFPASPSTGFTLESSGAEIRVIGTVSFTCAHIYIPPNKKSVHLTQHTSWESMLPVFLYPKKTDSVTAWYLTQTLNPTDWGALPASPPQLTKTSAEMQWLCSIQVEGVNGEIKLHILKSLKIKVPWPVISIMVNVVIITAL